MAHIPGHDRSQLLLLPEAVDDYVAADNPVRFIEAFVDGLDLAALGFIGTVPKATGRSSASAITHISWTCATPTVEPLQRINAKQECRSLETTVRIGLIRGKPSKRLPMRMKSQTLRP